ncbi:hypothetical protein HYT92_00375 [Candidatus Pacearchaeota archaeon]|nr:hypothetical protein [Candidatus Pacearchaeota archaeon]
MGGQEDIGRRLGEKPRKVPGFVLRKLRNGRRELNYQNIEYGIPDDLVSLALVDKHPEIALISAIDGRGTTDGSPPYNKFLYYSFCGDKHIITAYLAYLTNGLIVTRAWKPEMANLLKDVSMFHVNITEDVAYDRSNNKRLLQKHLERISEKKCEKEGLLHRAEKIYFDMLWNVSSF